MNQQTPTEKQTGKRIVSKGEYAARKTLAIGLSGSLVICSIGIALTLASFPYAHFLDAREQAVYGVAYDPTITYSSLSLAACFTLIPLFLIVSLGLRWFSQRGWKEVHSILPIHYANTADLPAPDSLVRASAEPFQEQQAVLLRAATEAQERHEEHLVRASVGGTE